MKYKDIRRKYPEIFGNFHLNKKERNDTEECFNYSPGPFLSCARRISCGYFIEKWRDLDRRSYDHNTSV